MAFNVCRSSCRSLYTAANTRLFAVKKVTARASAAVPAPEPETDTKLLATRCCGLNKFQDGEDPVLKADDEYPDWLWTIHTGKPRDYTQLDPNTKQYWYDLERAREEVLVRPGLEYTFYRPPRPQHIEFFSRLPDKQKEDS